MKDLGRHLMRGVSNAHNNIIQGLDDVWEAGSTTLIGKFVTLVEIPFADD